jgi:hypothetical protein
MRVLLDFRDGEYKIVMIQTLGGGRPCLLVAAAAAVVEQGINITRTSPPNDRPVDEANLINPQIHHHHPRALSFYVYTYSVGSFLR